MGYCWDGIFHSWTSCINIAVSATFDLAESPNQVNVVISGDRDTLLGVIAVMNSVVTNTKASLHFYITLPKDIIPDFRWEARCKTVGFVLL